MGLESQACMNCSSQLGLNAFWACPRKALQWHKLLVSTVPGCLSQWHTCICCQPLSLSSPVSFSHITLQLGWKSFGAFSVCNLKYESDPPPSKVHQKNTSELFGVRFPLMIISCKKNKQKKRATISSAAIFLTRCVKRGCVGSIVVLAQGPWMRHLSCHQAALCQDNMLMIRSWM